MYGSYAYGYGGYNGLIATASISLLLGFVAFVAAIVVTVLFYKKYIAVDNIHKVQPSQALKHHDWGPFFRFEHLIVENILKVLYIFFASLIAFESAVGILSSLMGIFSDPGAVLFSIIFILIICVVLEVVTRLWFEFSLLTVLIWKNTSAIRKSVSKGEPESVSNAPVPGAPVSGYASQQPSQQPMNYQQYASAPAQPVTMPQSDFSTQPIDSSAVSSAPSEQPASASMPTPPVASPMSDHSQSGEWTCSHCGAVNKAGSFCGQCGQEKTN